MLKLNIGCGNRTKKSTKNIQWINIDSYERENKLDLIIDITKKWLFKNNSVNYIYIEHFLEHLNWIDGKELLQNCYNSLKDDGIIRIVIPHFRKIFTKYLEGDKKFFKPFFEALNNSDYKYYSEVYENPEEIRKRKQNKPPEWHFTNKKRVKERIRHYDYLIDILNYMVYQYEEHKTLYDFESLEGLLKEIGFSKIVQTNHKKIDSKAPTRIKSSLYIEGIK